MAGMNEASPTKGLGEIIAPLRPPQSYAEQAYRVLREAVLRLDLEPGQRISENILVEEFGISRSPIRQSLTLLQSEGLVETYPQRASYITRISSERVKEACEMRSVLEAWAFGRIEGLDDAWNMDALSRNFDAQAAAVNQDAYARFLDLDSEFHMEIMASANNTLMLKLYADINVVIARVRAWEIRTNRSLHGVLEQHREILDAVLSSDVTAVKQLCADSTARLHAILNQMRDRAPDYFSD